MSASLREELSAYLDGELDPSVHAQVEAALRVDPALQADLRAISAARDFVARHAPALAPEGFAERVIAQHPRARARPWLRRAEGAGLALLLAAALALILRGTGDGTGSAPAALAPPEAPEAPPEAPVEAPNLKQVAAPFEANPSAPPKMPSKVSPLAVRVPVAGYALYYAESSSISKVESELSSALTELGGALVADGEAEGGARRYRLTVPAEALPALDKRLEHLGKLGRHAEPKDRWASGTVELPLVVEMANSADE